MKNGPGNIRIPSYRPLYGRDEALMVARAVEGGWITSDGPFVRAFEQRFSRYVGGRFGIATTNGTAALHVALVALNVGPGDEVILPDATMVACLDAVLYTGARPVLVDVDPATWTIDPTSVEGAITSRTRAIMPVHLYGHPAEMDRLRELGRKHGVAIVEDAAEAHGSEFRGEKVGALGDVGCFSFYANKILSTGEGGMVVTRSAKLAQRANRLRELAYATPTRNYRHTEVGFNYRLTDVQAAIGLAQLKKLRSFVHHRRECAALYSEELNGIEGITPQAEAPWARSAYWAFTVLLSGGPARRARLQRHLMRHGVASRVAFWPLHKQPFAPRKYRGSRRFPTADRIGDEGLSLPFGNGIAASTVQRVASLVRSGMRR